MPVSTDVNLPKHYRAKFPDRCVVCGCHSPASVVRLVTSSTGWWTWLLWFWGKPFVVKAPACRFCGWRLHFQRLVSSIVMIMFVWLALSWVWPMIADHIPRGARKWTMMGIGLVAVSPLFIFQLFFPHPFDITAYSDSVDYEFRDPELAFEFAELNEEAGNVKIG